MATERFTDRLFLLSGILVNLAAMVSARPKLDESYSAYLLKHYNTVAILGRVAVVGTL